jgi:putative Holliday junction resolvase
VIPKQLLGLDVGMKRTGVARGSMVARIAEPLPSLSTDSIDRELPRLIDKYSIDTIVVGLPRNLSGNDTQQTSWVRNWVDQNKANLGLPVYWQDEALTSKIAETQALSHKNPADSHSLAAAIVLQDFLDTPEAQRVLC